MDSELERFDFPKALFNIVTGGVAYRKACKNLHENGFPVDVCLSLKSKHWQSADSDGLLAENIESS